MQCRWCSCQLVVGQNKRQNYKHPCLQFCRLFAKCKRSKLQTWMFAILPFVLPNNELTTTSPALHVGICNTKPVCSPKAGECHWQSMQWVSSFSKPVSVDMNQIKTKKWEDTGDVRLHASSPATTRWSHSADPDICQLSLPGNHHNNS